MASEIPTEVHGTNACAKAKVRTRHHKDSLAGYAAGEYLSTRCCMNAGFKLPATGSVS